NHRARRFRESLRNAGQASVWTPVHRLVASKQTFFLAQRNLSQPSALLASLLAAGNLGVEGSTMMSRRNELRRAALLLVLLVLAAIVTGGAASAASHMVGRTRTLPDGTKAWFPRGAEVAKARKIISFRTTYPFAAASSPARHSRVYLWLVPLTGGGRCFVTNGA